MWIPVLPNLTWSKTSFTEGKLILCQNHHGVYACTPDLATMSGGDGMDSKLEYMLSGASGILWPCPVVTGAQVTAS
jgi:hypothetical protein